MPPMSAPGCRPSTGRSAGARRSATGRRGRRCSSTPRQSISALHRQPDVLRDLRAPAVGADQVLRADLVAARRSTRSRTVTVTPSSSWTSERYSVSKRIRLPRAAACAEDDRLEEVLRQVVVDATGWRACSRPAARGCVPQVCRRRELLAGEARAEHGVAHQRLRRRPWPRSRPRGPMSRMISIVRWLVMCARGVFAVQRYFVMTMFSTPSVLRNSAAELPAGPVPTIRTSVSTGLVTVRM